MITDQALTNPISRIADGWDIRLSIEPQLLTSQLVSAKNVWTMAFQDNRWWGWSVLFLDNVQKWQSEMYRISLGEWIRFDRSEIQTIFRLKQRRDSHSWMNIVCSWFLARNNIIFGAIECLYSYQWPGSFMVLTRSLFWSQLQSEQRSHQLQRSFLITRFCYIDQPLQLNFGV